MMLSRLGWTQNEISEATGLSQSHMSEKISEMPEVAEPIKKQLDSGLPKPPQWKGVKLVYLDPPYWCQAAGKYSEDVEGRGQGKDDSGQKSGGRGRKKNSREKVPESIRPRAKLAKLHGTNDKTVRPEWGDKYEAACERFGREVVEPLKEEAKERKREGGKTAGRGRPKKDVEKVPQAKGKTRTKLAKLHGTNSGRAAGMG